MALQRDTRYPGRWTTGNSAHPQGAFKNRSAPGALDGSYIEQDWANDWDGFFAALLNAASITPNGTVDTATASQYFTALQAAVPGRFLRTTTYTGGSFTWTKGAGTTAIRVRLQAPGGSGAGAPATAAGQVSVGSGGSGGSYAEGFFTGGTVPASASVTVPTAPTGGIGANGSNASPASFGALMSVPGGLGGLIAGPSVPPFFAIAVGSPAVGSGGNVFNTAGGPGGATNASTTNNFSGGTGGGSQFGPGGAAPAVGANGGAATGYGGGGQGCAQNPSSAALTGGRGAPAICIVDEYGGV